PSALLKRAVSKVHSVFTQHLSCKRRNLMSSALLVQFQHSTNNGRDRLRPSMIGPMFVRERRVVPKKCYSRGLDFFSRGPPWPIRKIPLRSAAPTKTSSTHCASKSTRRDGSPVGLSD